MRRRSGGASGLSAFEGPLELEADGVERLTVTWRVRVRSLSSARSSSCTHFCGYERRNAEQGGQQEVVCEKKDTHIVRALHCTSISSSQIAYERVGSSPPSASGICVLATELPASISTTQRCGLTTSAALVRIPHQA